MPLSYALLNQVTGKELKISKKVARDFFGLTGDTKKVLCMPFSQEQADTAPTVFEYKVVEHRKKISRPGTCIIRMGGMGDLIMLASSIREYQRRTKERVTVATLPQHQLFMISMGFTTISVEDVGKYEFDKAIDLRFAVEPPALGVMCKGSWSDYTLKDRSDTFDDLLDIYPARKSFSVPVNGKAERKINKVLLPFWGEKIVAINAAIVAAARSIPQAYIEPMCELFNAAGIPVVLFGQTQAWNQGLKDIAAPATINLIDKTTTEEMIALCSLADMIITPDSGPLHVGGALGIKTLGLFGNINPRTRISYYGSVRALYPQGEIDCVPCWDLHPCSCDVGAPMKCMELLTPDRIVNAACELGGY